MGTAPSSVARTGDQRGDASASSASAEGIPPLPDPQGDFQTLGGCRGGGVGPQDAPVFGRKRRRSGPGSGPSAASGDSRDLCSDGANWRAATESRTPPDVVRPKRAAQVVEDSDSSTNSAVVGRGADASVAAANADFPSPSLQRKRRRKDGAAGARRAETSTPLTVPCPSDEDCAGEEDCSGGAPASIRPAARDSRQPSPLLQTIPPDVVGLCLSYLPTHSDRFALQVTCRMFRDLSDAPDMVQKLDLGGDRGSAGKGEGKGGVIMDDDDAHTASERLVYYARMGNLDAIYMLGIIKSYCFEGAQYGIALLRHAATLGDARSAYNLGLVLRDSYRDESRRYLRMAASAGYLPAWQELLPAAEMKARHGDLDADTLRAYLDPPCLNRLLGRHYLESPGARTVHTSHCWNPLCGRWAFKATANMNAWLRSRQHQRQHPLSHPHHRRPSVSSAFFQLLMDIGASVNPTDGIAGAIGGFAVVQASFAARTGAGAASAAASAAVLGDDRRGRRGPRRSSRLRRDSGEVGAPFLGSGIPVPDGAANLSAALPPAAAAGRDLRAGREPETGPPAGAAAVSWVLPGVGPLHWDPFRQQHPPLPPGRLESSAPAGDPTAWFLRVARMKMCSSCRRAKYCSKLCQVYDWRSGRHKMECGFL